MNAFNARQLAQTYKLSYVAAENIIRDARERQQRRLLPLTVLVILCMVVVLIGTTLDPAVDKLAIRLPLTAALTIALIQQLLIRRRARQPILDAAQQASPQNN